MFGCGSWAGLRLGVRSGIGDMEFVSGCLQGVGLWFGLPEQVRNAWGLQVFGC